MKKQISKGILLTDGEQDILLPASDSRPPFEKGKEISLFVYNNRDSLRATERRPYGLRGDFAALTVKSVETFGVFADWGIPKDLFIPKRNLDHDEYQPGEKIIVRLIPNYDDDTTIGDCYVEDYLEKADGLYTPNQEVEILIYQMTGLGASAIINNRHAGLLYKTFAEKAFRIGDRRRAYIKKIRDDGKIDLSLFPQGYRKSVEAAEKTYQPTQAQRRLAEQQRLQNQRIAEIRRRNAERNAAKTAAAQAAEKRAKAAAAAAPKLRYTWIKSQRYVLIRDIARFYKLSMIRTKAGTVLRGAGKIDLFYNRRAASVNGVAICLTFAPLLRGTDGYLHEKDLLLVLDPLLRGGGLAKYPIRTIMIDPGHGGADKGAPGKSGLLEKNLNLSMAMKLRTALRKLGSLDLALNYPFLKEE